MQRLRALCGILLCALVLPVQAKDSEHKLDIGAMLQVDSSDYGEFYTRDAQSDSEFSVRRFRFSADYRYGKHWQAELMAQYTERSAEMEVEDAWLRYRGFKMVKITAGKFKQPFGLERLDSSSRMSPMERSMASQAFAPGRAFGIQLNKARKKYTWALGLFELDEENGEFPDSTPQAATGRLSWAPHLKKREALHLGLSASYIDWKDNPFRIRERGEVYAADNFVRSARFDADKQALLGLEAAWQRGPLQLQAEFMATRVDASGFDASPNYHGYYAMASYFLTGERRKYDKGEFSRVKPKHDSGAVEVYARYSEVDLREDFFGNAIGAEASSLTLGFSWHWRRYVRFSMNYLHPDISGDTLHQQLDGDAVTARLQLRF